MNFLSNFLSNVSSTDFLKGLLLFSLIGLTGCSVSKGFSASQSSLSSSGPTVIGNQIHVSWTANAGEQQGFYIEQSTDGTTYTTIQTVLDPVRAATIPITPGQTYYFRIQGYNQAGDSSYSAVITASL